MSNPNINFRVSKFQLARALHIIKQLEPSYKITSASNIVKTCFFDYLAKMNLSRDPNVPPDIIIELENFLDDTKPSAISLDDFIDQQTTEQPIANHSEKSTITSVSDFSPPDDWKEE
jgi:hypothetical protein